jgi:poly(3-hydroxyalkanoate) depolymerase
VSEPSPDPSAATDRPSAAADRSAAAAAPGAPPPGQAVIRYLDVDGVRLRTSTRGTGRPLLIISGLGARLELAEPFEREIIAHGIQVIGFDAPGVGESTGYRWPRRIPGIARTVERLLDAVGHQQVDVLGVSLGGVIAQQLAHQAPRRVRRLVLAATGPGVPGLGGIPGSPRAALAVATRRRYQSPEHYRRVAGDLYGGAARTDPDALLHGSPARFSHTPSLRGYLDQLYAISCWTALPWLRRLRHPTLVLAGDDDPLVPTLNGRILAHHIPNSRLHIVAGGGHLFLLEHPADMARQVADFLHRNPDDTHPPATINDDHDHHRGPR